MKQILIIFFISIIPSQFTLAKTIDVPYRDLAYSLEDRIDMVTTYSDRAKITRIAPLKSVSKETKGWIHFSSLPSNLQKNSIRVKLINPNSQSIEQVIIEDSFEQVALDKTLNEQIKKIKLAYGLRLDLAQQKALIEEKYYFVKNLLFAAPFSKDSYTYQRFNAPISQIGTAIDSTQGNSRKIQKELEAIEDKLKSVNEEIDFLKKHIQEKTNISSQRWMTNIYVKLSDASKIKGSVQLSYFIPNAWWFPIYDIRADLDLKKGRANIRLISGGLVEQHTGEDWSDVKMLLSTLSPTPLYLPLLPKWSFQEVREEKVDSYNKDSIASNLGSSRGDSERKVSKKKSKKRESYKELSKSSMRLNEMEADDSPALSAPKAQMADSIEESIAPPPGFGGGRAMRQRPGAKRVRRESHKGSSIAVQARQDIFPLSPLENIYTDYSSLNAKVQKLSKTQISYRPYQQDYLNKPSKISYNSSKLPAVSSGGRLIEIQSPFNIDLKNDEAALKIPLKSQTLYGDLSYFAIPKKDKRVFLRARTKNTTNIPLLAGKAQIFMNGDLITKTELSTISEDSFFTVELGVDKGIETQRIVKKKSEENGLVFKTHSTNVEVKIEISNSHNFPINIVVKDHYPQAPNDKITIELKDITPAPKDKKYGYLTWEGTIKAKEKKIYTFNYNVTHPENYIVSEFN